MLLYNSKDKFFSSFEMLYSISRGLMVIRVHVEELGSRKVGQGANLAPTGSGLARHER